MRLVVLLTGCLASVEEEVELETRLLEKQLEYAKLELEEMRLTYERDMRLAAIAAAEDAEPTREAPRRRPARVRRPGRGRRVENATDGRAYMRHEGPRPRVEVVVWNKIKGFLDWLHPDFVTAARERCSTECIFTGDRQRASQAQGVVFHAKTHRATDFPKVKSGLYMLVSLEQAKYAPLLKQPKYMRNFDATMTFDLDSTLPMITIHPHWDAPHYFQAKGVPWADKRDAAAAFVSNCRNAGAENRLKFLQKLMDLYEVHSYGRCLHNADEPPMKDGQQRGDAKRAVIANYKFYLAFENDVNAKDYVSEKVYDAFLAATLPVYRGTDTVGKLVPATDALLRTRDFGDDDPTALANHLRYLAQNKSAYDRHFQWRHPPRDTPQARSQFQTVLDMTAYKFTALCRICAYIDAKGQRSAPSR